MSTQIDTSSVTVKKQFIQEVDVTLPVPSFWIDKKYYSLKSLYGFLSPEVMVNVTIAEYHSEITATKPLESNWKAAATSCEQITEAEFWQHYNDAKRRIQSFEPKS